MIGRHVACIRDELRVGGRRNAEAVEGGVAKNSLADGAVGGASARQIQAGRPGIIYAAAETDQRFSFVGRIPDDSEPRLELLPRRRNVTVGWKATLADEGREEDLRWRRERVGLQLRVPTQAITQRQVWTNLPLVLNKKRWFELRDGLV